MLSAVLLCIGSSIKPGLPLVFAVNPHVLEEARFRTARKQTQEVHQFHLSYSLVDSQQATHTHRLFMGLSIFVRKVLLLLVFALKNKTEGRK